MAEVDEGQRREPPDEPPPRGRGVLARRLVAVVAVVELLELFKLLRTDGVMVGRAVA